MAAGASAAAPRRRPGGGCAGGPGRLVGRRAGPAAGDPAVDVALLRPGDRELTGLDVADDGGAGGDVGAVTDGARRDDDRVAADEAVRADRRVALGQAVVVGEDRARADVGAGADGRVAAVAEVRHLGAVADLGVLRLDEAADLAAGAETRAGPQEGERPDRRARTDLGELGLGAHDAGAVVDLDVAQGRVGADDAVAADRGRTEDLRAGVHDRVGADRDVGIDPRRRGVDDDGALAHRRLDGAAVELGAEPGELDLVVDPLGLPEVLDEVGAHAEPAAAGDADDVGEVLLALRVVGAHLGQGLAQQHRVEGVDPAVDLADRALLVGGVLLLDDGRDGAVVVTQHPAVAGRVGQRRRDDGDGVATRVVHGDEPEQRLRGQQRHVAVGDDHGALESGRERLERALDGTTGALDLVLVGDEHVGVVLEHVLGDLVALVPHDDGEVLGSDPAGGPQGMPHERAPADRVQHLGDRGLHACALASSKDDHGDGPWIAHGSQLLCIGMHVGAVRVRACGFGMRSHATRGSTGAPAPRSGGACHSHAARAALSARLPG